VIFITADKESGYKIRDPIASFALEIITERYLSTHRFLIVRKETFRLTET